MSEPTKRTFSELGPLNSQGHPQQPPSSIPPQQQISNTNNTNRPPNLPGPGPIRTGVLAPPGPIVQLAPPGPIRHPTQLAPPGPIRPASQIPPGPIKNPQSFLNNNNNNNTTSNNSIQPSNATTNNNSNNNTNNNSNNNNTEQQIEHQNKRQRVDDPKQSHQTNAADPNQKVQLAPLPPPVPQNQQVPPQQTVETKPSESNNDSKNQPPPVQNNSTTDQQKQPPQQKKQHEKEKEHNQKNKQPALPQPPPPKQITRRTKPGIPPEYIIPDQEERIAHPRNVLNTAATQFDEIIDSQSTRHVMGLALGDSSTIDPAVSDAIRLVTTAFLTELINAAQVKRAASAAAIGGPLQVHHVEDALAIKKGLAREYPYSNKHSTL